MAPFASFSPLRGTNFVPVIRFISIVFLAAGLYGCKGEKSEQSAPSGQRARKPLQVEAFIITTSSISEDVEVPGTLLPKEDTQIRPEVSGRVTQLNIPEGTDVPKGYLLVKLFDEDLKAQLRKFQVQLQIAQKTVERQRELLAIQGISQQEFDLSALAVDNLKADIQTLKIAIAKTEIRAPFEGQIGLRRVSVGAYLSPSDVITNIRDVKELKLEFSVPEKYAKSIVAGYKVRFRVDGGEDDHEATVIATEGNVEPTTRTLKVRAIVKAKHAELVPGVFAKVNLQLGNDSKALMLPTQAVIPQARNKRVIVFHGDSAVFRLVETGIRDSSYVQIVKGLEEGDTVITTGLMAIRPGSKVILTRVDQLAKKP